MSVDSSAAKKTGANKYSTIHESERSLSRQELRDRSVLRTIVARNKQALRWYVFLAIINEAIHMFVPVGIGLVIDHGIIARDFSAALGGIAMIILVRLIANWCWAHFFERVMEIRAREQHNLRLAVTAAALDPRSKKIDRPAGEVLSIATSDTDRVPDIFDLLTWALPASLAVVGAGVWLTIINPWVGLAVFISLAIQVLVLRTITPILSQKYDSQQSRAADAAATATDFVHGLRVLQGLGVQSRARAMYRTRSRVALSAALGNARYSGLSAGLMIFVSVLMIASVVVLSGSFTLAGTMSVGIFISIVGLVRNLSGMMTALADVPVWWASFSTSARRIRHLLSELGRSINEPSLSAQVAANSVRALNAGEHVTGGCRRLPGLGSISTSIMGEIHDGEIVAAVPATASDAQLVLAELAGLELPTAQMLIEPHAVDLFDGTLREQLATRAPVSVLTGELQQLHLGGADDESSWPDPDQWALDALKSAGADELLQILPEGLETRIMDRGANLSGGQRQRLALARALAADCPALVLHDPTTAVDAVTEQKIAEGLAAARRKSDRLTILVTKAPALLAQADRIVLVAAGQRVSEGTHRQLMNEPQYAEVVQR